MTRSRNWLETRARQARIKKLSYQDVIERYGDKAGRKIVEIMKERR